MKTEKEETDKTVVSTVSPFNYKNCLRCEGPKDTRIGETFQTLVPEKGTKREPKQLTNKWNPDWTDKSDEYLKRLFEIIGGEIIQEKALKFLKWKNFDVDEAMRIVKKKKKIISETESQSKKLILRNLLLRLELSRSLWLPYE